MCKYVLAVSGGVDSVVLLDIFVKQLGLSDDLIVAHFDHGIRSDSSQNALFVSKLAEKYGVKFESLREELGKDASEDLARRRRYDFLRNIAKKYNAKLVTAHHGDDVIETIAINLTRGTGWRGLAAMDSDVLRPLTNNLKSDILEYAKVNELKWYEDSTNNSDDYLRNRLRRHLVRLDDDSKWQLLGLWAQQKLIKNQIDETVCNLVGDGPEYARSFFMGLRDGEAMECLRYIVKASLTRPQLKKAIEAIRTALPHKVYHVGAGMQLNFTSRNFTVELIK